MKQYFPKPYRTFGRDINIKVNLFNYAAKLDLKNATGIDISNLAAKSDINTLKAEIGKLDVDKLKPFPADLSNLSNVVNNDVVKKTVYNKLAAKVNNIDTSGFILKTKYDTDKSDLEREISDANKKIPDTSGLVKKQDYSAKTTETECKIPSISGLATSSALTAVENKIPDISNLVKKKTTDYNPKYQKLKR